jgi:hypothetical protein
MSRLEQRVVIRYLTFKNLSVAKIATELQSVHGTDALKYSTVSKWRLRFQDGSDDPFDFARSEGLPAMILRFLFSHYCSNFHPSL